MTQAYCAYGLHVSSELELTGARPAKEPAPIDVEVRLGRVQGAPRTGHWHELGPRRARLAWEGVGAFDASGGSRILVEPTGPVDFVAQVVLGPVMGLLLAQRELYPLHASAVAIDGRAVAVAGDSGAGKSTLAAALVRRGHRLVTDDIAALEVESGHVRPGLGTLRLWPEGLAREAIDPATSTPLHAGTEKRVVAADRVEGSLPLDRVLVLVPGDEERVEEVHGLEAALSLLRFAYYPELIGGALGPSRLLSTCVELARRIRVLRLFRRPEEQALEGMCALVEG